MLSKHGAKLPSPEHRRSVSLSSLRNSTDIGLKGPILLRILEDDNSNKGASHLACSGCHLLKPVFQKSSSFMEPGCDHIGLTLPLLNVSQNGSWGLQRERERENQGLMWSMETGFFRGGLSRKPPSKKNEPTAFLSSNSRPRSARAVLGTCADPHDQRPRVDQGLESRLLWTQ